MKLARVGVIAAAILPVARWREPRKPTSDTSTSRVCLGRNV